MLTEERHVAPHGLTGSCVGEVPVSVRIAAVIITAVILANGCSTAARPKNSQAHGAPAHGLNRAPPSVSIAPTTTIGSAGILQPPTPVTASATDRAAAQNVVQKILTALVARDWASIYLLSSLEVTSLQTESQFAAGFAASSPTVVTASVKGTGQESSKSGMNYWTQPVTLEVAGSNATVTAYSTVVELVNEGGRWLLLSTGTPQPG